jgi:hypothetical protein
MPKSQIGSTSPSIRLHYPDGQFIVPPEVVEASLGHHVQVLFSSMHPTSFSSFV